jgi:NADH/F420H2 dehydrogenase subunit C
MDNDALQHLVSTLTPDAIISQGPQFLTVTVPHTQARDLLYRLRHLPETNFDYLFCLTGVDYPPDHMMVVYHLASTQLRHQIVVKSHIPTRENPETDTVCDIWRTAEFHEREVYDLFGITFRHHPDLRRLLLTDDWVGHPLRKDYTDPVNMIEY